MGRVVSQGGFSITEGLTEASIVMFENDLQNAVDEPAEPPSTRRASSGTRSAFI